MPALIQSKTPHAKPLNATLIVFGMMGGLIASLLGGCDHSNNPKTANTGNNNAQSSTAPATNTNTNDNTTRIAAAANLSQVLPQIITAFY